MEGQSAYDVDLHQRPNEVGLSEQDASAMDSEEMHLEDGGVSLNSNGVTTPNQFESGYILEIKTLYHQASKAELENFGCGWSLPASPAPVKNNQLKNLSAHPLVKTYTKHLNLITRHWNCQPEECLPVELQAYTPYSLSMLCALRALSSATKQNPSLAYSLLLDSQQQRILAYGELPSKSVSLVETFFAHDRPIQMGESSIWENPYGLMLCDVLEAKNRAQGIRRQSLPQKGRPRAKATLETLSKGPRPKAQPQTKQHQEVRKNAKAYDTPNDGENQISNVLNSIHFNTQNRVGRKKTRRLKNGGFSRQSQGKIALPSEKIKMRALPSFDGIPPATDDTTFARLDQLRLPSTATFESSLQLRPRE